MERDPGVLTRAALHACPVALALTLCVTGGPALAGQPPAEESRPAAPRGKVILAWDHLKDSNDRTFEDFSAFVSYRQSHLQVWSGEFTDGAEIGGYLKDSRRSTYAGLYRFRNRFDHVLQFETEQLLKHGFVLAGMLRGIHVIPDDPSVDENQVQFGTGFDWYRGDYDLLSFRAISDPREGGRWSFVTSYRLHRTEQYYVQPAFVIRTDRSTGWFVQGKIRWFRWMVGRFDRFDFTDVDRTIYSAGVELTY
jgi:hypothetical protein